MINVTENGDGSFTIEWDENDPQESILNDWTKQDFIDFFNYRLGLEKSQEEYIGKNSKKSGKESGETGISEATQKDWTDFWKEYDEEYSEEYNSLSKEIDDAQQFIAKDDRLWEGWVVSLLRNISY